MNQHSGSEGGKLETSTDIEKRISDNMDRMGIKNIDAAKLEDIKAVNASLQALIDEQALPDDERHHTHCLKNIFKKVRQQRSENGGKGGKASFHKIIDTIATRYATDTDRDIVSKYLRELNVMSYFGERGIMPYPLDCGVASLGKQLKKLQADEDGEYAYFLFFRGFIERAQEKLAEETAKGNGNHC